MPARSGGLGRQPHPPRPDLGRRVHRFSTCLVRLVVVFRLPPAAAAAHERATVAAIYFAPQSFEAHAETVVGGSGSGLGDLKQRSQIVSIPSFQLVAHHGKTVGLEFGHRGSPQTHLPSHVRACLRMLARIDVDTR